LTVKVLKELGGQVVKVAREISAALGYSAAETEPFSDEGKDGRWTD
jgi:hypothetical protein